MIVISHTFETGTLIYGTSRGDGTGKLIHEAGFRPSSYLPEHPVHGDAYWYMASTRRHLAKTYKIDSCADALREAGYEVTVEIDHTTLPTTPYAGLERERYNRADARTSRYSEWADSASATGERIVEQVREERSHIPLGQPHLIGHHSFKKTTRQEERRNTREDRGFEHLRRGRHWAERAKTAAKYQAGREAIGTTARRIDKLEAEVRKLKREMLPRQDYWTIWLGAFGYGTQRKTFRERFAELPSGSKVVSLDLPRNTALMSIVRSERLLAVNQALIAMREEEMAYWQKVLDARRAEEGVRVFTLEDFAVGDFAKIGKRHYEIIRRNPKTLTVISGVNIHGLKIVTKANARNALGDPGWTQTIPYTEVSGKLTAKEARSQHPEVFQEHAPQDGSGPENSA
ncbi:DUF3560 domain-containing protein [Actinocorallia sp. A-T 12471]|uniref:DUF3560 domain-containing protein n=1 Tax=Actinocorallia sp. A-T 12471 TaxID=3089813 RepID=UPI0029CCFA04|nr:DUF3560 domain-containing protein [Actinocorallia sp. A-T 12471]MDX6740450.1 DUF3560 domain-containing protein [Actinocorallia sp. A-T 12471]